MTDRLNICKKQLCEWKHQQKGDNSVCVEREILVTSSPMWRIWEMNAYIIDKKLWK